MIKEIIKDGDLILDVKKYDVILIASNILCSNGCGFQYQVSLNFPNVNYANKQTKYGDIRKLGTVKVCIVDKITFCLCYISKGNFGKNRYKDMVDYSALKDCLSLINDNFKDKNIACTVMGRDNLEFCGDENKIMEIIDNTLSDCNVYIYDYKQEDYHDIRNREWKRIKEVFTNEGYERYQEELTKYRWKNTFGIYKPIPNNLSYKEILSLIETEKQERKEYLENIIK